MLTAYADGTGQSVLLPRYHHLLRHPRGRSFEPPPHRGLHPRRPRLRPAQVRAILALILGGFQSSSFALLILLRNCHQALHGQVGGGEAGPGAQGAEQRPVRCTRRGGDSFPNDAHAYRACCCSPQACDARHHGLRPRGVPHQGRRDRQHAVPLQQRALIPQPATRMRAPREPSPGLPAPSRCSVKSLLRQPDASSPRARRGAPDLSHRHKLALMT